MVSDSHFLNGTDKKYSSGVLMIIEYHSKLNVTLKNCSFVGNTGSRGGNVGLKYVGRASSEQPLVSIQDCNISSGHTRNVGGGLYMAH